MSNQENTQVVQLPPIDEQAVALRKQNCDMLRTLRDHLAENIRLHGILNDINSEINRIKQLLKTPKPKIKRAPIVFGILLLVLLSFPLLIISAAASSNNPEGSIGSVLVVFSFLIAIIGALCIIVPIVLHVKATKKWNAYIADLQVKLAAAEEQAAAAQQAINEYWENYALPYIKSLIPDRFPKDRVTEYYTVCGMLYLMENLQADTIKEAINLYDEHYFRSSMQNAANQMNSRLSSMAKSAARTAAAAERSAVAAERSAIANESAAASAASMALSAASAAAATERMASASVEASHAVRDRINRDY